MKKAAKKSAKKKVAKRRVLKSAIDGKFTTKREVAEHPLTTVTQTCKTK